MPYRPYVIKNKKGKKIAMRGTDLFETKTKAINNIKKDTKEWTELNWDGDMSKYEFGAYKVGDSGYKFKKGRKGNVDLLGYAKKHSKNCKCGCKFNSF